MTPLTSLQDVCIAGLATLDAPHRVLSADIGEQLAPTLVRLGLDSHTLETLTGIVARRFWDDGVQPSSVAARAGVLAMRDAHIDKSQVGLLINTSVCKDYIEPSVASLVHGLLGLSPDCQNFDVGNACLGFLDAMRIAGLMIEQRRVDYALIVNGEGSRYITEQTVQRLLAAGTNFETFRRNFAALTLGSGAVAMVLAHAGLVPRGPRLLGSVQQTASQHSRLCLGQPDEMTADPQQLLVAGLQLAGRTFSKYFTATGSSVHDIDHLVIHQISAKHTDQFIKRLQARNESVYRLYPEFGNLGPASVPTVLSKLVEEGKIARGNRVVLAGIGSGLNCAVMGVEW